MRLLLSLLSACLVLLAAPRARAESPALTLGNTLVPSPAAPGASAPILHTTADGLVLTWTESTSTSPTTHAALLRNSTSAWTSLSSPPPVPSPTLPADAPFTEPYSFARFPDGSLFAAYFDDQASPSPGLFTRRHHEGHWSPPAFLEAAQGNPSSSACPLPHARPLALASGHRAALAWFSVVENPPRILVAFSSNAGTQFFQPTQIDDGHPLGPLTATFLPDGSLYIAWIESADTHAALWLRRLSPSAELSIPILLATGPNLHAFRDLQLTQLDNSHLLLAYTADDGAITQLTTRLLTLPPPESFATGRPCLQCPPSEDSLPGHPLRGYVLSIDADKNTALVRHSAIPGIMPAQQTTFHLATPLTPVPAPDTEILARAELRPNGWWLTHVQIIPHRQLERKK